MILKSLSKAVVASGLLVSSLAWADPMAVKDGVVFVLTGIELQAYPVSPTGTLPTGCPTHIAATTAKDILISRKRAILVPGTGAAVFDSIDISACLSELDGSGNANADLKKGTLEIMCAKVDDGSKKTYYHVIMKQRGSSMNWEVTFAEPDASCTDSGN